MLRDRLVCGINHEGIQRKLLAEKKLTYEKDFGNNVTQQEDARPNLHSHVTDVWVNIWQMLVSFVLVNVTSWAYS